MKTEIIQLRVSAELKEAVKREAFKKGIPMSKYIVGVLKEVTGAKEFAKETIPEMTLAEKKGYPIGRGLAQLMDDIKEELRAEIIEELSKKHQ